MKSVQLAHGSITLGKVLHCEFNNFMCKVKIEQILLGTKNTAAYLEIWPTSVWISSLSKLVSLSKNNLIKLLMIMRRLI